MLRNKPFYPFTFRLSSQKVKQIPPPASQARALRAGLNPPFRKGAKKQMKNPLRRLRAERVFLPHA